MVRPRQRRHDSMTSSVQQLAVYILTTLLLLVSLRSVETTEHEELEIMMPYASPNQVSAVPHHILTYTKYSHIHDNINYFSLNRTGAQVRKWTSIPRST